MTEVQRSVLLVEDDADHRSLLDACLQRAVGYRVVGHAETGEDAERLAESFQPDVVLLDLRLRDSWGTDSIPHLMVVAPRTMIVAISARRDPASREAALSAGAFAFAEKSRDLFESATMARLLDTLSERFADVLAGGEAVAPISVNEDESGS